MQDLQAALATIIRGVADACISACAKGVCDAAGRHAAWQRRAGVLHCCAARAATARCPHGPRPQIALETSQLEKLTGREKPTVIT